MKIQLTLFATMVLPLVLLAQDQPPDLDKIEAALKTKPEDPMLHYRKCQALFAKGMEQEAVDHAAVALAKFRVARNNLPWMLLGSFKTGQFKVDVHYNMGPGERNGIKDGILRPLSFRVWTSDAQPKLVRVLDFERAYLDNMVMSAAVGEMKGRNHSNYGTLDPKSDFATIKKKVIDVLGSGE
jgi:hypothetical protein